MLSYYSLNRMVLQLEQEFEHTMKVGQYNETYVQVLAVAAWLIKELRRFH
jgi:hypothetical protein